MSAANFKVNASKAFSGTLGPQLLNTIENLNQSFSQLLLLRAALIQQKDGATNTDTDYVTPAAMFGFVAADGITLSSAAAHLAFNEIDSMVTACTASLQQMGAKFKQ